MEDEINSLRTPEAPEKQTANAIYDSDAYRSVFEQDMREATETMNNHCRFGDRMVQS